MIFQMVFGLMHFLDEKTEFVAWENRQLPPDC